MVREARASKGVARTGCDGVWIGRGVVRPPSCGCVVGARERAVVRSSSERASAPGFIRASSSSRRDALATIASLLCAPSLSSLFPAVALADELGILDIRRGELKAVLSTLEKSDNKDELALAEKNLLETQIKAYEINEKFVSRTRQGVVDGSRNFLQHAVLEVKDLDKSVKFWTQGLGMKVNRTRGNQAFVSFGPETLTAADGGKFALELVENPSTTQDNSGQFFQFALSNSLRVNRVANSGGDITFGFGYFEITAPDGYKVVVYIENRRDPFDLVGVYVNDVDAAAKYYERVFGMAADRSYGDKEVGRFEPARIKGSVLMTYGAADENTGILLVPKSSSKEASSVQSIKIAVLDKDVNERKEKLVAAGLTPKFTGEVPGTGGTKVSLAVPREGVPLVFVDYNDFEREQPKPAVLTIGEEIQAYVAMAKDDEN
ncbi:putative glyoxalase [Chloropicon primus]|uniref:Putative glyoxalase n=3 Tax=Chloropicon primus TaxID=1764295 RepID=A0A5B8MYG2_9CHLO|nr:putative glyoxalase [Chloropicon primus]UPR03850.1 putative glyoxalase [Chloropicon primus]|eukprot:QDZ24642.1 putative glyoxalase [Chloropicon primus]